MSYTEINYLVSTNEDWRDAMQIEDDDGPVSLAGSSFIAHIRRFQDDLAVVLECSTSNGLLTIADGQDETASQTVGVLSWNVTDDVLRLIEPGEYVYDVLWSEPGGSVDMIAGGSIQIVRGITRLPGGETWQ